MTSFAVIAHSLSFWVGYGARLADELTEALLTFSLYPEGIFSAVTRWVLYTLIPAGFVSYLPFGLWMSLVGLRKALLGFFVLGIVLVARSSSTAA